MSTPHISAQKGEIAPTVLMPGDPLRARFIAQNYLEAPRLFNEVRGMLGYTGLYQGSPVSVMGSGMGMPSMGIYAYELFSFYDVQAILRLGSAGAYSPALSLHDLLLVTSAYSDSSFAAVQSGYTSPLHTPSASLCQKLRDAATRLGLPLTEGRVYSSDVFYRAEAGQGAVPYWQALHQEQGCLAVEMESFALFQCAALTGKSAACLLTISDSFVREEALPSAEREKSFTSMMEIALESL